MSDLPKIRSVADDRQVPLFPCFCGDDGGTCEFATGRWRFDFYDGDGGLGQPCTVVYSVAAKCSPSFLRLGPESRKLVMSLYRAIVERFYIMRATGTCGDRPAGDDGGFGFSGLFLACNDDPDKQDLAGRNRRRAFGGVFRDTFRHFVRSAYCGTAKTRTAGGATFYPVTPYVAAAYPEDPFLKAMEVSADAAFCWSCGPQCWRDVVGFYSADGRSADSWQDWFGSPWLVDNTMQVDFHDGLQTVRPLLSALAGAYRAAGYSDADDFDAWIAGSSVVCRILQDEGHDVGRTLMSWPTPCFGKCGEPGWTPNTGAVEQGRIVSRFFRCGWAGPRFSLPALAYALRVLSVMNAQTVSRPGPMRMPHRRITVTRTMPIDVVDGVFSVGPESVDCQVDCFYCSGRLVFCAGLGYSGGSAGYARSTVYYNFDDRDPPPRTVPGPGGCDVDNPAFYCIKRACWTQWGRYVLRGSAEGFSAATAEYSVILPVLSDPDRPVEAFGQPVYPALWAVNEGDVAFGTVSAFVWNGRGQHVWVKAGGDPAEDLPSGCGDFMSHLAGRIIAAARNRLYADVDDPEYGGPLMGNSFSGAANVPVSAGDIRGEMTGCRFASNLSAVSRAAAGTHAHGRESDSYSYLRICGDQPPHTFAGVFVDGATGQERWDSLRPADDLPLSGGTWLPLAVQNSSHFAYSYNRDYNLVSEGDEEHDPQLESWEARNAWTSSRQDVQFGGFFGSFIFNNRAARQVS